MSKLTRKLQKIFGGANISSPTDNLAQFGSLKEGSVLYSSDPDVIQALGAYETGWKGAVVNNNAPALQDMNAIQYLYARQLAYIFENGIPEYSATTTYFTGSLVRAIGGAQVYQSLADDNLGESLSDITKWVQPFNPPSYDLGTSNTIVLNAAQSIAKVTITGTATIDYSALPAGRQITLAVVNAHGSSDIQSVRLHLRRNGDLVRRTALLCIARTTSTPL
jgi:hypothetical protein